MWKLFALILRPAGLLVFGFVLLGVSCGDSSSGLASAPDPIPRPPTARSVVLYLVDTLRADHLASYGYARPTSPRIDEFAQESLLFERCMAQSTWTKPATATVLTGLYASQHGVQLSESTLPESTPSLSEMLGDAGLRTGAFITNQWVFRKNSGLLRTTEKYRRFGNSDTYPSYTRAEPVVDGALSWIEELGEDPFFCYIHTLDPHAPYAPPEPFDRMFGDPDASDLRGDFAIKTGKLDLNALEEVDLQRLIALYDGEIAYTDQQFGRLLDGLDAAGRSEDTLVIFVADHGEEFNEHGSWRHNPFMHPEVINVPLIMRFPGASSQWHARREDICGQVDIVPTILDALGLPALEDLPGRSLMIDPGAGNAPPRFSESEGAVSIKAVLTPGHKYIRQWSPAGNEIFYDLTEDPDERTNLKRNKSSTLDAFRQLMDSHVQSTSVGFTYMFQNGKKDYVQSTCRIVSDAPFVEVGLFYAEDKARSGPTQDGPVVFSEEDGLYVASTHFHVRGLDGDGLNIVPAENATFISIEVGVDDQLASSNYTLLGMEENPTAGMPIRIDLEDSSALASPRFNARVDFLDQPYRIRVWGNMSSLNPTTEISEEDQDALRALGYTGDE